jgi:hypothetical protein
MNLQTGHASVLSRKSVEYCIGKRNVVMPANAGIQAGRRRLRWIAAFAGMTETGPRLFTGLLTQDATSRSDLAVRSDPTGSGP